jgi:chromosome segregation ATPase
MLPWRYSISAATALLLLILVACNTDEDNERQGSTSLNGLAQTQQEMTDAFTTQMAIIGSLEKSEASLQKTVAALEAKLLSNQDSQTAGDQRTANLSLDLTATSQVLSKVQEELSTLSLSLGDLRDSFLVTRLEVGVYGKSIDINAEAIATVKDSIKTLQGIQSATDADMFEVKDNLAQLTKTNQDIQTKIDDATPYASATNAYFDLSGAITQAAKSTATLSLQDAITKTGDIDLQTALDDWLKSTPVEESQFLNIFLDILGTKLYLALTSS